MLRYDECTSDFFSNKKTCLIRVIIRTLIAQTLSQTKQGYKSNTQYANVISIGKRYSIISMVCYNGQDNFTRCFILILGKIDTNTHRASLLITYEACNCDVH